MAQYLQRVSQPIFADADDTYSRWSITRIGSATKTDLAELDFEGRFSAKSFGILAGNPGIDFDGPIGNLTIEGGIVTAAEESVSSEDEFGVITATSGFQVGDDPGVTFSGVLGLAQFAGGILIYSTNGHASQHGPGGADPIKLDNLDTPDDNTDLNATTGHHGLLPKLPNDATKFIDGTGAWDTVKDADLSFSDITTNNVSTTKHGLVPKAPNDATKFLDGTGAWSTPSGGGSTLPVVDTTGVVKGSSDATKILRFEVDGFTTATTRVLTPQNSDYTIENTAHSSKHVSGGSDSIKIDDLAAADDNTDLNVTSSAHGLAPKAPADATKFLNGANPPAYAQVKDSDLSTSNITTNNASTSKHGFLKKLDNNTSNFMRGDGSWAPPTGAGTGWALAGHYDFTITGAVSSYTLTGISSTEIFVVARLITKSVSGRLFMQVSVDNGGSYYSASGDYKDVTTAGIESNTVTIGAMEDTNATAARSGFVHVQASDTGLPVGRSNGTTTKLFTASTSAINAIKLVPSAGGNITGGDIYVYVR